MSVDISTIKEGLLDSALYDIATSNNEIYTGQHFEFIVHTDTEDLYPKHIESVDIVSNYNTELTDFIIIKFMIGMGDVYHEIWKKKDNLEVTVKYKSVGKYVENRYKAVILNKRESIENPVHSKLSRDSLNRVEAFRLELQCIHRYYEILRTVPVWGMYRDIDVHDLLLAELGKTLKKIKTSDVIGSSLNINLVKPDNDIKFRNIVIPPDTNFLDLPTFMQEEGYGVYNGAIGTYIQNFGVNNKPYLFIYPLYKAALFDKAKKKLIIYKTNTAKYDNTKCSHTTDGDIVKLIAGSQSTIVNSAELKQIDTGIAVTAGNPLQLVSRNVVTSDTGIFKSVDSGITGHNMYKNKDGIIKNNYVGMTANLFKERSNVIRNSYALCQIRWNFPDMSLIYPGMPVRYIYEDVLLGTVSLTGNVQSTAVRYNPVQKNALGIINIMVGKL